jgi:hypothetical protein
LTSTLFFCDDLRHSRCKSSCIISSPIRPMLHCGSMPLATLHRLTSPRSHRVRFVIGLSFLFLPVLGAEMWVFQPANQEVLTRLNIASTFDTQTARRTIEALDAQGDDTSDTPETRANRFRVIVLDTVTALLGPQLSGVSSQGNTPISAPSFVLSDPEHDATNAPSPHACRTCGNDDVYAPPPRRGTEGSIVHPRELFLWPIYSHHPPPPTIWDHTRPVHCLIRVHPTGAERRDDSRSPRTRPIFYLHE